MCGMFHPMPCDVSVGLVPINIFTPFGSLCCWRCVHCRQFPDLHGFSRDVVGSLSTKAEILCPSPGAPPPCIIGPFLHYSTGVARNSPAEV